MTTLAGRINDIIDRKNIEVSENTFLAAMKKPTAHNEEEYDAKHYQVFFSRDNDACGFVVSQWIGSQHVKTYYLYDVNT